MSPAEQQSGSRGGTPLGRRPRRPGPPTPKSPPLLETAGPEADTPLDQVRLAIGQINGTHGVEGEMRLRLTTDDPGQLRKIKRVYIGDEPAARRLIGVRFHQGAALIRVMGVRTVDQARELFGQFVRISGQDARPLQPGEFYWYQAIGLTAYDEAGESIGVVADILETGANEVFVIRPESGGQDVLIPNIPSAVLELDPAQHRMVIRPLRYWGDE